VEISGLKVLGDGAAGIPFANGLSIAGSDVSVGNASCRLKYGGLKYSD
jgi:hypothetical protein